MAAAMVHPNMGQEELAALFSRNLTFASAPAPAPAPAPVPEPIQVQAPPQEEPKIVYISQHYTHTAHIARQAVPPPPRAASEPPQAEHVAVETVLSNHGVDPSCLSSAQLQLFKTVDDAQKLHLINIWRVCPPTNSLDNPTLAWSMTSISQEEILANLRHEQRQRAQQEKQTMAMSLDGTPLVAVQAGDGRWIMEASQSYMDSEPYMATGYEEMARREYEESARKAFAESMGQPAKETMYSHYATAAAPGPIFNPAHADPVYANNNSASAEAEWRRQEAMADQYGRMMATRGDEEML